MFSQKFIEYNDKESEVYISEHMFSQKFIEYNDKESEVYKSEQMFSQKERVNLVIVGGFGCQDLYSIKNHLVKSIK